MFIHRYILWSHKVRAGPGVHHGIAECAEQVRIELGIGQRVGRCLSENEDLLLFQDQVSQDRRNGARCGSHDEVHLILLDKLVDNLNAHLGFILSSSKIASTFLPKFTFGVYFIKSQLNCLGSMFPIASHRPGHDEENTYLNWFGLVSLPQGQECRSEQSKESMRRF